MSEDTNNTGSAGGSTPAPASAPEPSPKPRPQDNPPKVSLLEFEALKQHFELVKSELEARKLSEAEQAKKWDEAKQILVEKYTREQDDMKKQLRDLERKNKELLAEKREGEFANALAKRLNVGSVNVRKALAVAQAFGHYKGAPEEITDEEVLRVADILTREVPELLQKRPGHAPTLPSGSGGDAQPGTKEWVVQLAKRMSAPRLGNGNHT